MKPLSLVALSLYASCALSISAASTSSSTAKETLPLTPASLAYFNQSLEFYHSVIDPHCTLVELERMWAINPGFPSNHPRTPISFNRDTGLSGVFERMWKDGAEKICNNTENQAYAIKYWHTIEQDPTYTDQFNRMRQACNDKQTKEAIEYAKRLVILGCKDITMAMLQDNCVIKWPEGDLNSIMSLQNNTEDTVALFKANENFDSEDTKVRGCSITQCYATQQIVEMFSESSQMEALAALAMIK